MPGSDARRCVAIALGTNLGDRVANLRTGIRSLRRHLDDLAVSPVYETVPRHVADQPLYLNACCTGRTGLTARQLLAELKRAERLAGRTVGGERYGPRILDLDLLLYGTEVIEEPGLTVPHPRMADRAFVLIPLRDIAADWRVPAGGGKRSVAVAELADRMTAEGMRRTDIRLERQ